MKIVVVMRPRRMLKGRENDPPLPLLRAYVVAAAVGGAGGRGAVAGRVVAVLAIAVLIVAVAWQVAGKRRGYKPE